MARKRDPVEVISCGACGYSAPDVGWDCYDCPVCGETNAELYETEQASEEGE